MLGKKDNLPPNRSIPDEIEKVTHTSGATSSVIATMFHLLPTTFLRRVAKRFTVGAQKHGEYNYRKGLLGNDIGWIKDRINHIDEHFLLWKEEGSLKDDNLSAMGWGIAVLMEAEQKNPELVRAVLADIYSSTRK